mgnify:FL=1
MYKALPRSILYLLLCSSLGCDLVTDPLVAPGGDNSGGEGVTRKVLLEDFTGHRCNNCPAATRTATQLHDVYGEDLIVVGVHATDFFGAPANPPNSNGSYATDFRTEAGTAYATTFSVSFLPTGMVSRRAFNSSLLQSSSAWGSDIADIIGQPADLDIWFSQLDYNPDDGTVSAEVKVAVVGPVTDDHNLTIYLIEDHVVDWQLDNEATPPDVENYEHRHVLRTTLNGTWGVPLITGAANTGDTITLSYPDFAVDPSWQPANCALVAYAYNTASNEVMQVAERNFQP